MTHHTVRDGLFPVDFEGKLLGSSNTHRPGVLRWVEMDLYYADAGQDETSPLLRLPEGGYVTHVVGQSVVAHRHRSTCGTGLKTFISEMIPDALPCPECKPDAFPVMRQLNPAHYPNSDAHEEALDAEADRVLEARLFMQECLDVESPKHSVRRASTAREAVRRIVGQKLSWPAEQLLHEAAQNDPAIKAAMADPLTMVPLSPMTNPG